MNLYKLRVAMVLGLAIFGLMGYIPFHHIHHAHAMPENGKVIAGTVKFSGDRDHLVISQDSKYAVIEWSNFSIAHNQLVLFKTKGPTLNRVVGRNLSNLDGYLGSNNALYLVNPNGIVLTSGGAIEVDHFFPTVKKIETKDFMAGLVDLPMGPLLNRRNANIIDLNGMIASPDKGVLGNIFERNKMKAAAQ